MSSTYRIIQVKGHYEVYDDSENFVLSGDTYDECHNDLMEMIVLEAENNIRMENIRRAVAIWVIIGLDTISRTDIKVSL